MAGQYTHGPAEPELVYVTRAELDRLRANQLPDGGEWVTQAAHRGAPLAVDGWTSPPTTADDRARCARNGCRQRLVWYGPAKPITGQP